MKEVGIVELKEMPTELDLQNTNMNTDDINNHNHRDNHTKNIDDIPYCYNHKDENTPVDLGIPRDFGNTIPLLFYKNEPLIVIGPQWTNFALLYCVSFIIYLAIYVLKVYKYMNLFYNITSLLSFIFFSFNYITLAFKNPGIPPIPINKTKEELRNYCQCSQCHCVIDKDIPLITFHCSICQVCIIDFNHHCSYATKCIGQGNSIFFYLFLISLPIFILDSILMLIL